MASVLSSFFSRDPKTAFPFELPTEASGVHRGVSHGDSHKKAEPSAKATCFWANAADANLKNQTQKLKTLRHPNVLTFFDSLEFDGTFYLVTEPCAPVDVYFEQNQLTGSQQELFVSWGLYQMLNCLKFLHNEVKISQNNIRESIFITASGDWKLSGFQRTEDSPKTDLNALADVVWQVFNGFHAEPPAMKSLERIPRRLHGLFKKLDSKTRAFAAADLLSESRSTGGFFKNKFVDTLLFLDEFQLKDSAEKQSFFMNLKDNLDLFPDNIAKYKILPKLIHTYEYGDAGSHILIPMFKLGRLLDEDEYQHRIVPCLVKLFSSPDRSTRVKLLERIDEFAPHLKPQVVNEKIYGQVPSILFFHLVGGCRNLVTGFMDTNPAVRESTVKAMVVFAEKLNYNNLNMDLMKYLAKLQGSDDQPGIRTNTTICLGKIGCFLDPSHRQRILINAFTRALKDPFPPARMAGVLALSATQQYYSLVEVANKILPALAPLTVDPDKQVRDQGFKSLRGFLENLEKASENPEIIPELEAQVKAGGKASLLSTDKVPQWAGWALKTLSGKFYKNAPASTTTGAAGGTSTGAAPTAPAATKPTVRSGSISSAASDQAALEDAFNSKPPSRTSSATPSPSPSPVPPAAERAGPRLGGGGGKKPLVLKKPAAKRDPFLAELDDDSGWGAADHQSAVSLAAARAPAAAAAKKATPPPKKPLETKVVETAAAKDDGNASDGDWETSW
ncbi:hypothetical protein M3Y99_01567000 [Aphelenchoides fujianensis]|nr:hypothetical protein M3Y99_01567000 [Aphelenchoides fujianensis]